MASTSRGVAVMMAVMTAQPPLPLVPVVGAVPIGAAAALVQDGAGGRVFLYGVLSFAWDRGDEAGRRFAAVQLVRIKAAQVGQVAAGFGVDPDTVRRWGKAVSRAGAGALVRAKPGPKGPSRLTGALAADIRARRRAGATLAVIAAATGVSTDTVRRALVLAVDHEPAARAHAPAREVTGPVTAAAGAHDGTAGAPVEPVLPVLPAPVDRTGERVAARWGLLEAATPVFAPAARVPLAGLFLAVPALVATGLLTCANEVYTRLPGGFYGLDTMFVEGVLRALAGEPRAEGATRIDPIALGRVLGLDRAPEVKTIRRKIAHLAAVGKAGDLQAAVAAHHLGPAHGDHDDGGAGLVLYVDGHVRAYQGTATIAKTHLTRLRFPAPATVETWVSDSRGDPVLVVMAAPGASLAAELARLLPELRTAVGDDRRVLVGFDRGGWSPALFAHMAGAGFDVLTWRKGPASDVPAEEFTEHTHLDETGRAHTWQLADTVVDLPTDDAGAVFTMRQITRLDDTGHHRRQVHILTTRTDLPAVDVVHRMGSRWRQENYFRYARMHFDLDSHDNYATTDDDPHRLVPNPAKRAAYADVSAARARYDRALARTDAAMLAARSPAPGIPVVLTNATHNTITTDLRAAEAGLTAAQEAHRRIPVRVPLGELHPDQQVLDVETKLITHAIRMAAFNTATTLARDIRINTTYARAGHEAHVLARQILTHSGDIDPTSEGFLTIRLDPLPTKRATDAIAELCEHLTATNTHYPGTNLTLRYDIKTRT